MATGPGVRAPFWESPRSYQPTSRKHNPLVQGATNPIWIDADGDGDMDLYVVSGGVECEIGSELLEDRLYLNDGVGRFTRVTGDTLPAVRDSGSAVAAADFDCDGDLDLFVQEYSGAVAVELQLDRKSPNGLHQRGLLKVGSVEKRLAINVKYNRVGPVNGHLLGIFSSIVVLLYIKRD